MSKNNAVAVVAVAAVAGLICFTVLLSGCGNVPDPVAGNQIQTEPSETQETEDKEPECSEISFASDTVTPVGNEEFSYHCDNFACYVPSNFMVEIWEYACVKYLRECEYEKAENNLKTMNWQCTDKKNFGTPEDTIEKIENVLNEARNAKLSSQTPFICSSDFFTVKNLDYLDCIK